MVDNSILPCSEGSGAKITLVSFRVLMCVCYMFISSRLCFELALALITCESLFFIVNTLVTYQMGLQIKPFIYQDIPEDPCRVACFTRTGVALTFPKLISKS